jgi:hypothetical protein
MLKNREKYEKTGNSANFGQFNGQGWFFEVPALFQVPFLILKIGV